MNPNEYNTTNKILSLLFIIVPTILLITGYLYFPTSPDDNVKFLIQIPIFLGLIFLFIGFLTTKYSFGKILKTFGWIIFAFYWSTQPYSLYINEGRDIFNGFICVIGVYILFYLAYHEWLSYLRKENISSLNWIVGASSIAGLIYFGVERSFLSTSLIYEVARESAWILDLIIGKVTLGPVGVISTPILYDGTVIVSIIFACTAVQSMVIFVGMILALPEVNIKKKIIGLLVTVLPVYILNLFRNALVAFLLVRNITDFNLAHNVIAKIGSLIALVVLLLIIVKIIPEVFDKILSLTNIYKRNGPLEKIFNNLIRRKS